MSYNSDYRHVKNTVEAINDLDGIGPETQDIIAGHGSYVYAISANHSNPIIWEMSVGSVVGSVLPIPDISADGLDDVVAVTSNGIFLLEGKNGTIIWSNTTAGSYFRDVQLFNDINDDDISLDIQDKFHKIKVATIQKNTITFKYFNLATDIHCGAALF